MKLIGVVFFGIVFSIFLIPLTDAGTTDIWEQCSPPKNNQNDPNHVKNNNFCCYVGGNYQWLTNECDFTPPTGTLSISKDYAKPNDIFSVTISGSDNTQVDWLGLIKPDGTADWYFCGVPSCSNTWTFSHATEGSYTYNGWVYDNSGNFASTNSKTIIIDGTPPVITITSVGGDTTSPYFTTDTTPDIVLSTNEQANCRYSTTPGINYDSMTNQFSPIPPTTGTSHSTTLPTLAAGTYNYYAICTDTVDNKNPTDKIILFDVCIRANPTVTITPPSQNGEPGDTRTYTVSVTNNDQNCGTETFGLTLTGCPPGWTCTLPSSLSMASGSTKTATLSITSSSSAAAGVNMINVEAKNQADNLFKTTAFATYSMICVNKLSIKPMADFDATNKIGNFLGIKNTWTPSFVDSSSSCVTATEYSITHPTDTTKLFQTSEGCHSHTGLYKSSSTPPAGTKLLPPYKISVPLKGELNNAFKVYVQRIGAGSCVLSFVTRIGSTIIDPSFTVSSGTGPKEAPHVGLLDFSGDKSSLNVTWEAFYPDNEPFRDMKVKCALFNPTDNSCDPEIQDCSSVAGKTCSPYDASQGTAEVKKGDCDVSSPAFDFNNNNKIICVFYDSSDASLKTRVEPSFTPIDFAITTANKIVTTVGKKFDLKVDVVNNGTLKDSYKIGFTGPETLDISPATITTQTIGPNQVVSVFSSITPVVGQTSTLTVRVTSLTSGKIIEKEIEVKPGLFALPEFGLIGFLQIIAIAAVVYFLLVNRQFIKKKRRR